MKQSARILVLYLEPTPYIAGLLEHLAARFEGVLEVYFVGENLSQAWYETLPWPLWQILPDGLWHQFRLFSAKLRKDHYNLVHLAGWSGHPILHLLLLLASWHGVPVTMESDTPLPTTLPVWKRVLKRLVYPLWFLQVTKFLPGGTRQMRYLQHYGVSKSRIVVARMTVDVANMIAFANQYSCDARKALKLSLGLEPDSCVFLFTGRLEPHKGISQLLRVFSKLDTSIHRSSLLLVGDGSMYDVCVEESVRSASIQCTGRLSGTSLYNAYLAADVLVLPSLFEPWGLVVNEAMAMGLPVIASDQVGCVEDLVVTESTGIVVPVADDVLLAKAMQMMLENTDRRLQMGANARNMICSWTLEAEAETMVTCWQSLLA